MKTTIIFDLDQTLADTRHLAAFREAGDWAQVMSQTPNVRFCEGVPEMLAQVQNLGYLVTVVSTSPREYCEAVCVANHFQPSAIIGYHDVIYPKPSKDGYVLGCHAANTALPPNAKEDIAGILSQIYEHRWNWNAVSAGDSWKDIMASSNATIDSIACLWQADDRREVILAEPTYIAETPADLSRVLGMLRFTPYPKVFELQAETEQARSQGLWLNGVSVGDRRYLNPGRQYSYVYRRIRGDWRASKANGIIRNLKLLPSEGPMKKKMAAVARFVDDLIYFLPIRASIMFIPPSKLPDHPRYDDRWQLVWAELSRRRTDLTCYISIQPTASRDAVHESDDIEDRAPELHLAQWRWVGGPLPCQTLYVIDDVLTSGGSFEAASQMVEANSPGVALHGVFWARQEAV